MHFNLNKPLKGKEFVHTSRSTDVTCYNKLCHKFSISTRSYTVNVRNPSHTVGYTTVCWTSTVACWQNGETVRDRVKVSAGARECTTLFFSSYKMWWTLLSSFGSLFGM